MKEQEDVLKIKVKDIRSGGLDINTRIPEDFIGLTDQDYLYFITPLEVNAKLERVEDTILSKVHVKGRYSSHSYRSLDLVRRDWENEFTLDFPVDPSTDNIDLGESIRQEVILRIPMRILSDAELKAKSAFQSDQKTDEELKTYRPFENLKDIQSEVKKSK